MRGGAAWGMLMGKDRLQVTVCDPYLHSLKAFAKTCYTKRRYLYLYLQLSESEQSKSLYRCTGMHGTQRIIEKAPNASQLICSYNAIAVD